MSNTLRYSRYNHMVELEEGRQWGLINLFTMATRRLDIISKDLFEHLLEMPESNMAKKFKMLGFLVDYDEDMAYRAAHKFVMSDTKNLSITIAPTLDCNFRCPYCFEQHIKGVMSKETQERLVYTFGKLLDDANPKRIMVNWFGGEPLLCPDIIENLTAGFLSITNERGIEYSAKIITNGYLLTPDMMDRFSKCCIKRIQVTLDGMKENNDKTRILVGGGGSFDRIIQNLRTIRTDAVIAVRINVNKENATDFEALKSYIEKISEESGNKIRLYSAHMDVFAEADNGVEDIAINIGEYYAGEVGNSNDPILSLSRSPCMDCGMSRPHSFVIDPEGGLYKCWNRVGRKEFLVGNIFDPGNIIFNQILTRVGSEAISYDITLDEECRECKVMPQCNGGCRYVRSTEGKKAVCLKDAMIPALDDVVKKYFMNVK